MKFQRKNLLQGSVMTFKDAFGNKCLLSTNTKMRTVSLAVADTKKAPIDGQIMLTTGQAECIAKKLWKFAKTGEM